MGLLCSIFGHKPPVYRQKGWWSPGEEYAAVILREVDGIGRQHAEVRGDCARCGELFLICRVHLPNIINDQIKKLLAEVDELREALKEAEDAMRFVYTSCATFPQEPQYIQNAAWRRIVNALTKARAAIAKTTEE